MCSETNRYETAREKREKPEPTCQRKLCDVVLNLLVGASSPGPSREASDHRKRVLAVRWQVFGLTGCEVGLTRRASTSAPTGPRFPTKRQCLRRRAFPLTGLRQR